MSNKDSHRYGLWPSPITPRGLAEQRRLEAVRWDSDGETLVWLEGRSGRGVLMVRNFASDAPRELNPELDVRAEVGYGGGDFTVHGGEAFFVVHKLGRIFRQPLAHGSARPITPAFGKAASPTVSADGRWVAYVHHDDDDADRIAVVDGEGTHWPQVLTSGHDFYMQPCWSPDGSRLAWIAWDHPRMPWDGTLLYLAEVEEKAGLLPSLGKVELLAGGPEVAIQQPEFTPDGRQILYVSDETGWSRIAAMDLETRERRWITENGVEYGMPAWVQGMRSYAVSQDGRFLVAAQSERGMHSIRSINLMDGSDRAIEALADYTDVSQIAAPRNRHARGKDAERESKASGGMTGAEASGLPQRVAFVASGPAIPPRVVEYDFQTRAPRIVARSSAEMVPLAALARCVPASWKSTEGEEVFGLFYAPPGDRSGIGEETQAQDASDRPPLVVLVHGGPTSQARAGWSADAQFFATRGYAVLLVNYRGSTGYGRNYMLRLRGNWGLCDVEDAVSGARHLAETGKTDPARAVIMGGSAGGFTVLQTMIDHPDAFAAGICLYGVANQFHLASETHKFEAHYLDSLLGPLPEAAPVYRQRSPLLHADRIRRALAIFQGEIDRVVPRQQSDLIVEALRRNGTPCVYHVYEGEGHGWRKRETIEHFYGAVEAFLREYALFV